MKRGLLLAISKPGSSDVWAFEQGGGRREIRPFAILAPPAASITEASEGRRLKLLAFPDYDPAHGYLNLGVPLHPGAERYYREPRQRSCPGSNATWSCRPNGRSNAPPRSASLRPSRPSSAEVRPRL